MTRSIKLLDRARRSSRLSRRQSRRLWRLPAACEARPGTHGQARATRRSGGSSSTARGSRSTTSPPDKGTTSVCYGACAALWPPLTTHGQAGRRARRPRLAARHDEAQGRQARGHLRRPPALLLRDRPQARPDDRPGRQPVRRPVVGHLGRRQGDPPWLAHPATRPTLRRSPVRATRPCRRRTGAATRGRGRPLPRRRLDPLVGASTPSSTTTPTSRSCRRSARSSCSASSAPASSASSCSRRCDCSAGASAT